MLLPHLPKCSTSLGCLSISPSSAAEAPGPIPASWNLGIGFFSSWSLTAANSQVERRACDWRSSGEVCVKSIMNDTQLWSRTIEGTFFSEFPLNGAHSVCRTFIWYLVPLYSSFFCHDRCITGLLGMARFVWVLIDMQRTYHKISSNK